MRKISLAVKKIKINKHIYNIAWWGMGFAEDFIGVRGGCLSVDAGCQHYCKSLYALWKLAQELIEGMKLQLRWALRPVTIRWQVRCSYIHTIQFFTLKHVRLDMKVPFVWSLVGPVAKLCPITSAIPVSQSKSSVLSWDHPHSPDSKSHLSG